MCCCRCSNSTYRLKKRKKEICSEHHGFHECCGCPRPFHLFCFPSKLQNNDQRQRWIQAMKRDDIKGNPWKPGESDRVCSKHFEDGQPTLTNPLPNMGLGYEKKMMTPRRKVERKPYIHVAKIDKENCDVSVHNVDNDFHENEHNIETVSNDIQHVVIDEHSYCRSTNTPKCADCQSKGELIKSMGYKLSYLTHQVSTLIKSRVTVSDKSTAMTFRKIKTDKKMNFDTGLSTIALFNATFLLLKPYLPNITYWKGTKWTKLSTKVVKRTRYQKLKKLSQRDELILTLMRLRLNLLNEDLADRFGISTGLCSQTFTTWIKIIGQVLGNALIVWLPRDSILNNLPHCFNKKGYSKCRIIIDCAEVFIERPKSLEMQYATWSEYKHHNTIKFLVGISPSGFITFLSDCYGGRKTDKFITQDSGFYGNLERDETVMADRGFTIQEELLHHHCHLVIPPGKRAKSQMTESECLKTKTVANLRIHVERAINRIKTFRILKGVLPISMLQHTDDIVRSCAAICNLKPVLIQDKS